MVRLLAPLWLLLALLIGGTPARAFPLGQRVPILTPGACANITLKADFVGGVYCLNGASFSRFIDMPGASFSRSSGETCQWIDGHLTYAVSGQPCVTDQGLGVWESRTNQLLQSQFASGWTGSDASLSASAVAAPDGTVSGGLITEDGVSTYHYVKQTGSRVASTTYTFSVYAKRNGRDVYLELNDAAVTNGANETFNLTTCAPGASGTFGSGWSVVGASATLAANGYCRVSVTIAGGAGTNLGALVGLVSNSAVAAAPYQGNGSSGAYAWGADVEAGGFPTPYIPTTAASATRASDIATLTLTPSAPYTIGAKWIGTAAIASIFPNIVETDDGTINNRVLVFLNQGSGAVGFGATVAGTSVITGSSTLATSAAGTVHTAYIRVQSGAYAGSMDGAGAVDATGTQTVPATNSMVLGGTRNTNNQLNSYLQRVTVQGAVSDAQMRGLPQ